MSHRLQIGLSSCPNDTFIFHALLHDLTEIHFDEKIFVEPVFADVEMLNSLALNGTLPITKVSAGVLPAILDKYVILGSGGALGWGCGPLLVAQNPELDPGARIAIPGKNTTANLLLGLHAKFTGPRQEMLFSDIIPAIQSGDVDAGVIIHEGRFVYENYGLAKIIDFGEWWENTFSIPLPLGVIVARRDIDPRLARAVEDAITASIKYAKTHPEASRSFIRHHAQELNEKVTQAHINTFVTDYSLNLGHDGRAAIQALLGEDACKAFASTLFMN